MQSKKRGVYIVMILVFIVLMITAVSAGFSKWLKTITGFGSSSEPTNVSITVSGVNPVRIEVWNSSLTGTAVDPTENSTTSITFNVTVMDPDGVSDINDSSVKASLFKTNEATRTNTTACTQGGSNATSQNYTCSVPMWYWDAPGAWTINVTANDLGNKTYISNTSMTFSYNTLQSIIISPPTIYWPSVSPGNTNQTPSAGNFTTISNIGNYNATNKTGVNAVNLYSGANFISVGNFTVDIDTGTDACSVSTSTSGTTLQNGTDRTVINSVLERGNVSAGGGNETFYYCLTQVPTTVPSGTYDTSTGGSWYIKLL